MVYKAISKVTPSSVNHVGMKDPTVLSNTSIVMPEVHQFQKEASEEDLKYALLHGSQGLRQHLVDQGEILVSGHESEEAQQSNSPGSEHEEELEDHDELFVAHNDSIIIPETRQEAILKFQQVGDNNIEEGVQCDELSTPTIRKVPRKKRTQSKRMDRKK
ncbi:hypothetical protein SUGI_1134590 [Cryptomeria japonica]|nr:hypothetical protein SUGI_1134590 [Cryptomeria japonica]